jgi:hypothetical protein
MRREHGKWKLTDEVDTSQLLESLEGTTGQEALAECAAEALDVRGSTKALRNN